MLPKACKTKYFSQQVFTCSNLTIDSLEQVLNMLKVYKGTKRLQWRPSGVLIVNFEYISHLVLVFQVLTSNMYLSQL